MLSEKEIKEIAGKELEGTDMFVVDVKMNGAGEIEVLVDSDTAVSIDACAKLSRIIEAELDKVSDDFALTVSSAGIGQPLKMLRQYRKLIGKPVEVLLFNGTKITAELKDADEEKITIAYTERVAVEGKKRKQDNEVVRNYSYGEIKSTVEHLDFK